MHRMSNLRASYSWHVDLDLNLLRNLEVVLTLVCQRVMPSEGYSRLGRAASHFSTLAPLGTTRSLSYD